MLWPVSSLAVGSTVLIVFVSEHHSYWTRRNIARPTRTSLQFPHASVPFPLQVEILEIQLAQAGKRTEGESITANGEHESCETSLVVQYCR
jgi:hypothetical protein